MMFDDCYFTATTSGAAAIGEKINMTGWSILCRILFYYDIPASERHKYPHLCRQLNHQHKQLSNEQFIPPNKTTISKFQSKAKCPPQIPATSPTAPTSKSKTSPGKAASPPTTLALRIWTNLDRYPSFTPSIQNEYSNRRIEGHRIARRPG